MRTKLSEFLETLSEEKALLQQKISAIDALIEAYQPTDADPVIVKEFERAGKERILERDKECFCGRPANHKGIHRGGKIKKSGVKREGSTRGCSFCHESGHNATTCPDRKPEIEKVKTGDDGPLAGMDDSAGERVRVFKAQNPDANSVACARYTRLSLAEVNKYW